MSSMFRVLALAVSVSVLAAACGDQSQQPATDAATKTAEKQLDSSQGVTAKLSAYIDCFNRVDAHVHTGAKHYTGWMQDPFAGPIGRGREGGA
ncbi:YiiG family protein [Xanthomonas populi]|uniref:YiiG family protein n=1 Tax=Xanthomonas populi TaxID=53414 RepID=UPI001FC8F182|nr:YiiG family protein [Xanthomonas populi]